MDTEKVLLLAASAGARYNTLPPHLQELSGSEEFWEALEATPEDQLTPVQREMLSALGVELPRGEG